MPYTRDFDLIIPDNANYIRPDEILPGLREHLRAVGIEHPDRYEHFQIRILVRPRAQLNEDELPIATLFGNRTYMTRKQKRRAFSSVDSVFISLTTADEHIVMRETYPTTTNRDGQPELALGATIFAGAGGKISGAKASAEIHAKVKKEYRFRDFMVVAQRGERLALWDFRKSWFEDGRQPEVCITCSVPKDLPEDRRFVRCQRRVTADGREVIAPKSAKKIALIVS